MAENGQGGTGGSGSGQSFNHGPGSFAHNNADQLPGGQTKARETAPTLSPTFNRTDPLVDRQIADLGNSETARRTGQSEEARRAKFNASRARHAPVPAPVLRPTNSQAQDRATFAARQREEFFQSRREEKAAVRQAASKERAAGPKAEERGFKLDRQFAAVRGTGPDRSLDRGR